MGQQQLLLIVLGTIIVGVSVVVGINMFSTGAKKSEADMLYQDMASVASAAAGYWRKPTALGGGNRDFGQVTLGRLGVQDTTDARTAALTSPTTSNFIVTLTGMSESLILVATIDNDGTIVYDFGASTADDL